MGFLVNFGTGPTEHHRVFEMHTGASLEDSNRILEFGYSTFTGIGTTMSLKVNNGTPVKLSENVNFHSDKGTTHFAVLKFEMSTTGNDVISAYLDPVGLIEPATPSAQVSVAAFTADSMGPVNFVFGTGGLPAFDELRSLRQHGRFGFLASCQQHVGLHSCARTDDFPVVRVWDAWTLGTRPSQAEVSK